MKVTLKFLALSFEAYPSNLRWDILRDTFLRKRGGIYSCRRRQINAKKMVR